MDAFMPIDKGNIMLVLLSLTTTSSAIEWLIAALIVEWWASHGLTPHNEEVIDHSLVWHDLWAHAAHGFGVDEQGETQAQVIQQTYAEQWCTKTSLTLYWKEIHNKEAPSNIEQILQETKPLADDVFSEWQFTEYIVERVVSCCRYLLFPDSFW